MAVRLLFLLFVAVLIGFSYLSILNGQAVNFYLSPTRAVDVTTSELVIISFSVGAALVILAALFKDVVAASKGWKERRERQRLTQAKTRVERAKGLFERGLLDDAAVELSRSIASAPDDLVALDLLARVEAERGNLLEAVKALTKAKQADPSDLSIYLRLATLHREMGDPAAALSILSAIESSDGGNPRALAVIRDLHVAKGELVNAYAAQKRRMKILGKAAPPADASVFTALRHEKAIVRIAAGKADDGERRLREIVKETPTFAPSHVALADLFRSRGKIDEATETLIDGFRATRHTVFLIKLEDLAVETERPQAMLGVYEQIRGEFPTDVDVNLFFGKFLLRLEMNDAALEQLLRTETLDPECASTQVLLAEALRRRGRYETACQHYQRAIGYKRRYLIPYRCGSCGAGTIKWAARCPDCGAWDRYAIDHGDRKFSVGAAIR